MRKHLLVTWLVQPLLFCAVIYFALRLLLIALYPEYFAALSTGQIVQALMHGLRFDVSIATISYAVFLLVVLVLQFFPRTLPHAVPVLLWGAFALLATTWLLFIASIGYFGEVYRHIGNEIFMLSGDTDFIISLMTGSRLFWALGMLLLVGVLALLWQKLIIQSALQTQWPRNFFHKSISSVVIVVVALLCVRGFEVFGRPVGIADAYALGNEKQAAIMMNGAFSIVHNARRALKDKTQPLQYFNNDALVEAEKKVPQTPFVRAIPSYYTNAHAPRNVVLVLLESWSYKYIDGLAGSSYGVTPFMDSLIKKSATWSNAYAAGQRSIEGIQAVLTSVPLIEGRQTIGFGLEQSRVTTVAAEANQQGYRTVFMQTSKCRSFHVDAIAGVLGFSEYYSMEDYPVLRDYGTEESEFGWDYEGLMHFAERLNQPETQEQPTFSFFFTGTTHEPFPDPGAEFHAYPHDHEWQNRYLNTLKYSDWALSQFMEKMRQHPRYNDTVFIFVADHVLRASMGPRYESFHIPLIIYTPDGSIPAQQHTEFVSQYDLLPTLDALLGLDSSISTFGRSLLTEPSFAVAGALGKQGNIGVWLAQDGWSSFDAMSGKTLEIAGDAAKLTQALEWSKLRLQRADERLRENRWYSAPDNRVTQH